MKTMEKIDLEQRIFALRHLESNEFICLLQEGIDYLAAFSDGDTALEFRASLGLHEHVDLFCTTIDKSPFKHFWLDGENVVLPQQEVRAA